MGMPRQTVGPVVWVSQEESDQLQALRLNALEDARYDWSKCDEWPCEENWPYRSVLRVWGRDRDQSVLATASVQTVGHVEVYRRNARLVKRNRSKPRQWVPYTRAT